MDMPLLLLVVSDEGLKLGLGLTFRVRINELLGGIFFFLIPG